MARTRHLTSSMNRATPHMRTPRPPSHRLLFVTGKGGVGKTTVAAALAVAAADDGRRTLVCELAGQRQIARAYGVGEPADGGPVLLRPLLWHLTIDPDAALAEWIRQQPGGRGAAALLTKASAFRHLVAAAPGLKELVIIGQLGSLAGAVGLSPHGTFDLVVVDAPATGHFLPLLGAPRTFARIARGGRVRRDALALEALLADRGRTGCAGVTVAEDMPMLEVLELDRELPGGLDAVFVNQVWPVRLADAEAARLAALRAGTADLRLAAVLDAALWHHARARRQAARVAALRAGTAAQVVELPELFADRLGPEHHRVLARRIRSVAARPAGWRPTRGPGTPPERAATRPMPTATSGAPT